MIYGLQRTVAPAAEPVTLAKAKEHLRIEHTLEDILIGSLITAAREWCEDYQQKAYITQTWTLTLDRFPAGEIAIFRPPLQSAIINYDDVDNVNQLLDASVYVVDTSSDQGGRIALAYGQSWPSTYTEIGSVVITFVAGYGASPEDVSGQIKAAMNLLIAHWYEHRESVSEGTPMTEVPMAVTSLLGPRRVLVSG